MTWFRPAVWPERAAIIATSWPCAAAEAFQGWAGIEEREIPALTPDDIVAVARSIWRRCHREINPDIVRVLAENPGVDGQPAAGNALWLSRPDQALTARHRVASSVLWGVLDRPTNETGLHTQRRLAEGVQAAIAGVAAADPGHAGWQRARCLAVLQRMDAQGMHLDPPMRALLEAITQGLDLTSAHLRGTYAAGAEPDTPSLAVPGGVSVSIPTPHPRADPDRVSRLNQKHQRRIAGWRVLPWWRRLRAPEPQPPSGI